MGFKPNGLDASRGNRQADGNPPAIQFAVNRTTDVGVRRISCQRANAPKMSEANTNSSKKRIPFSHNFKYKAITRVGFWNVTTLWQLGRLEQTEKQMLRFHLGILCLSETKRRGNGEELSSTGKTILLNSGEDLNQTGQRIGGVGIMLTKESRASLIDWKPISNRLMTARFRSGVRNITIINCYAPHEEKDENEKTHFYQQLNHVYDSSPRADIKIVIGDFNAKIGSDNAGVEKVMGRHGLGDRNENGEMLVDFCVSHRLTIGGSLFPHKTCNKITWVSPDGRTENQIDHCMIQQKWRKCLRDVRSRRGADVGSDHHLVIAEFQLKTAAVRRRQSNQTSPKFNVEALKNPESCHNFVNGLRDRTTTLNPNGTINEMWGNIKTAFIETGLENVPKTPNHRAPWISDASWELIDKRRLLKNNLNKVQDQQQKDILRREYKEVHKMTQRSVRRDKRKQINDLAKKAEAAASRNDAAELYKITKEISGGKTRAVQAVADENGRLLATVEDQMQRWRDYFCKLLNEQFIEQHPPVSPEIQMRRSSRLANIETTAPTMEEIVNATILLKDKKAAGIDGIPAEFLKANTELTGTLLFPLFQKIWEEEVYPSEWKEGVIVKIPKKGNLSNCNNWRGLTLLSVFSKIMARIILERIKGRINSTLKRHQAGFRCGQSCVDHINTLRIILEQSTEYNAQVHLMFVDFEKAFDRVNQEYIWRSLGRRGIPEKIINVIKASYNDARCRVLHNGRLTEPFAVKQGVRQGCILSPILFLVVIDDILTAAVGEKEKHGIQWTKPFSKLSHLDYADDVCLMAHTRSGLNEMSQSLYEKGKCAGLKINTSKTQIMSANSNVSQPILLDGELIKEVQQCTYLGGELAPDGGAELDVNRRISKARTAFGKLSAIWQSNIYSLHTKLRLFESNVKSVLLYACETWKVTASITKKLQTYINRCLRRILNIRWPRTISNSLLWQLTKQIPVEDEIRKRKWRWIGHTLRRDKDNIARQALDYNPQGNRRLGRPRKTWKRTILKEIDAEGQRSWLQVKSLAADRDEWKRFVNALCSNRS